MWLVENLGHTGVPSHSVGGRDGQPRLTSSEHVHKLYKWSPQICTYDTRVLDVEKEAHTDHSRSRTRSAELCHMHRYV